MSLFSLRNSLHWTLAPASNLTIAGTGERANNPARSKTGMRTANVGARRDTQAQSGLGSWTPNTTSALAEIIVVAPFGPKLCVSHTSQLVVEVSSPVFEYDTFEEIRSRNTRCTSCWNKFAYRTKLVIN